MPSGTKIISAVSSGVSPWAKTVKINVVQLDGAPKRYCLKASILSTFADGRFRLECQALCEGEYESQLLIEEAVGRGFGPIAWAWGELVLRRRLSPFIEQSSLTGRFGFHCATVCGSMQRTVLWDDKWANSFTHLFKDVIGYDNRVNPPWPEYDRACRITIDLIIP
ncbi:hypothetical protein MGG_17349 [Pyricularia oryzae 70-15]|uniref:Uncharacterized protein n=1 Tax=Pyricularia oryzae (strain 70-15 / ATCC MYA-4617 / FGSC 8958) TaxID=242507 RepID=G4NDP4_PYRO7|nr:uncharacterized protein MGG_17349 [Pyricularia oryzae 70-15]EHA48482.1 hypothetical protein MGG_17349 [Pyricularia oryzae 70-15]